MSVARSSYSNLGIDGIMGDEYKEIDNNNRLFDKGFNLYN